MNRLLLITAGITALGVILVVFAACKTSRAGYETAPYETVRKDGSFEIRDYTQLVLIEAPMGSSERGSEGNESFGQLFEYITGKNSKEEKIAMTTPVFMTEEEGARRMAFVMPADMVPGNTPQPADKSLSVRTVAPGRYVTYRFSGGRSAKKEGEALDTLRAWMKNEELTSASGSGAPVYGYFDPPWTPGPLRRNEVMIEISSKAGGL
jgi:hypothetical protein